MNLFADKDKLPTRPPLARDAIVKLTYNVVLFICVKAFTVFVM